LQPKIVKNYIAGQWCEPAHTGLLDVENPSTAEVIARTPLSTPAETNRAVQAAAEAFGAWRETPAARRVQPLMRLAALMRENEERLAHGITEEMGKSLPDSRAEVKRAVENCEVACGMPMLQQGDKLIGASAGIDGEVLRLPLGVFALAGPFNFPGMVPFWFFPYAVAAGNTYVVKPSERVPLTMQNVTELIAQTDLPPGVFNLVNGDRAVVDALLDHPAVRGFSLVGASRTCRAVAEKCARNNKRCQAMGSAKNHLVVMPDARIDEVVRNMITSCYGCAGQRCMAASAIVAVGHETYRNICDAFVAASRQVIVADPLDPRVADEPMVMGPVISARAKRSILEMIETGVREGAKLALDGRGLVVPCREKGHFIGPTVLVDVQPGMEVHKTEIFGPVVVILRAGSFDEAVRIVNDHQYGNGASIYTRQGYWARRFKLDAECGMIGVNVGIPAPVAHLPFGGMKASLFSDIKAQGRSVVDFFTEAKVITERYSPEMLE
jgi:malonate-semialdehyde dehydrogenase (acetylating) / methylmalonate-semialdehyde dehydrogenase